MYLGLCDNGISITDIARVVEGTLYSKNPEDIAFGVSIDSRTISEGDIFFAIKGENFDGYDFIPAAIKGGACCIVASKAPSEDIPYILVDDTIRALGLLAREYRRRFSTITIAVTGSVGKTTTKEFIYSVLDSKYKTNKTDGNFNNEIGLPLTLFKLNITYKAMVVEMGMSKAGEIAALSAIAEPDIAVITNIGSSHIENLGSREAIRDAKLEIIKGMKEDGILILNGDEPLLRNIKTGKICKKYIGIENPLCHYNAINIRKTQKGYIFDIEVRSGDYTIKDIETTARGKHNIYNAMCAAVCGMLLGISEREIKRGILGYEPVALRGQVEKHEDCTFILDCYNASPESMEAAVEVLDDVASESGGRRVAVLGEMLELGTYSHELHEKVGKAYANGADLLITVGENARHIANGAKENGMSSEKIASISYDCPEQAANDIRKLLHKGDIVLFKASRRVALENVARLI